MCKTSQPKPGNGVLARMRHLKGQIPSPMGDDSARQAGADGVGGTDGKGGKASPTLAPVIRLLTSDVLTEACCMLDAKSLATAAAACRSFREVFQGRYPWRGACCREWGLQEVG
ncbi:unnamed protein product, partial [Laminaria digitata]